jgi:cyanophycin synthetase
MVTGLGVEHKRLLPGCSAGLAERTAMVDLRYTGQWNREAGERIRAGVTTLCPEEPLYRVCESDWPAAFLAERVEPLGDWVVAVTVGLQRWARDPVWRGRVVSSGPGRLRLAIPWRREAIFGDALELAVRLIERWSAPVADRQALDELIQHFRAGLPEAQDGGLPPNTLRFIQAAVVRDIPFEVLPSWVQLGWGARAERIDSSFTGRTTAIATMAARNKFKASRTLADAGLPLPTGEVVADLERAQQAAARLGWPVVVKPLNQDQGRAVVPGIRDPATLRRAFDQAAALSPGAVIVEDHIDGASHRLLVVGDRLLAAARLTPAAVVGDGTARVVELIEVANSDPRRGTSTRSLLKRLALDAAALDCLGEQDLSPDAVPAAGRQVLLRHTANISTGGTAVDVTDAVHPDNRDLAERAARTIGLDIAGIDFLCPDIARSWREVGGAICEVNAQPGFRPHWIADPRRDINGEVIDIVFAGRSLRIPTAAITGTNGKSTTAEMLYRIWTAAGALTGVCTTQVLRIGAEIVHVGNLSGQPGARVILNDPGVQAGVFEMPRKGLIYFGHPCDSYDVAALLNLSDDHLGVDGIDTLEQMAELKAEVLARARRAVVVNADDPLCLAMRARAGTDRHILVTRDRANPAVAVHRRCGGEAVVLEDRDGRACIVLAAGESDDVLMAAGDIPATRNGLLRHNETNAMFAAAMAWAQGVAPATIRAALGAFGNSVAENPGRYNVIDGLPYALMLDFAHNPAGVAEICAVAAATAVSGRRILASLTVGSRHAAHFAAVAAVLAESFDEFVLGCDSERVTECADYDGDDPVATMLTASRELLTGCGVATERIRTEADPHSAIRAALDSARPGDLVVLLAEPAEALPVIDSYGGRFTG